MDGMTYIAALIVKQQPVMIRLTEGRDISAVPVAQDGDTLIIKNTANESTSLIYKKAISVITPLGG